MPSERLFFAAEITAAWPEELPQGRLIEPELRHLTLAFLGMANREELIKALDELPLPSWTIGPAGILDEWLFLPEKSPHVVAMHATLLEQNLLSYQQIVSEWFLKRQFLKTIDPRFLAHVSIARDPSDQTAWAALPSQIPFFIRGVGLFKSLGHSNYEIIWHKENVPPFEEIEHTADIAYHIRGNSFSDLMLHAVLALAFSFPAFSRYLKNIPSCNSINDIVSQLNRWTSEIDQQEGIGLKAVSYHAKLEKKPYLEWTMIVDV